MSKTDKHLVKAFENFSSAIDILTKNFFVLLNENDAMRKENDSQSKRLSKYEHLSPISNLAAEALAHDICGYVDPREDESYEAWVKRCIDWWEGCPDSITKEEIEDLIFDCALNIYNQKSEKNLAKKEDNDD